MSRWEKLQDYFDAGRQQSSDARHAILARCAAEAPELHGELERLLDAELNLDKFLEPQEMEHFLQLNRLEPGQVLGRYRVISLLGRGGMGEVYRAVDQRLQREVAIKVLPVTLARSEAALDNFQREVQAVAALNHPHIVAIHDFGSVHGVAFAVTELLIGETLRQRLKHGVLNTKTALHLGRSVAKALGATHARGIVHGDLKPENLFLTSEGWMKILDFGLAQQYSEAKDNNGDTLSAGTPGYMAPELTAKQSPTPASDIYAFACVLHEMLTGTLPEDNVEVTRLPAPLASLIQSCMAQDPSQRPVSMETVSAELDRLLAGASSVHGHLPSVGSLIGREEEIEQLQQKIVDHGLVTLTATGGCGKTRLAIALADIQAKLGRQVHFVDLSALSDDADVPAVISRVIGLDLAGETSGLRIGQFLAKNSALMIVDNCEHLLNGVAACLEEVLANIGEARVLATSRQALGLSAECLFPIVPLPADSPGSDAVALFNQRAKEIGENLDVSSNDAIVELCQSLDGLPLAIELAVARLPVLSPEELLERIHDRFKLLVPRDNQPGKPTLGATIDWSFDLLPKDKQAFFLKLGVFPGSFSLSAAAAVCDMGELEALDQLDALVSRSLLVADRSNSQTRYRYLETLRAYARESIPEALHTAARDAHLAHFSQGDTDRIQSLTDLNTLRVYVRDFIDLVAAAEWAAANENWTAAGKFALKMGYSTALAFEYTVQATQWVDRVLEQIHDDELIHKLRANRAALCGLLEHWPDFMMRFNELKESADPAERIIANINLGMLHWFMGQSTQAYEFVNASQEIEDSEGPTGVASAIHYFRGILEIGAGYDPAATSTHFQEGIQGVAESEFIVWDAHCVIMLATMQAITGQPATAIQTLARVDWTAYTLAYTDLIHAAALLDMGEEEKAREMILARSIEVVKRSNLQEASDALVAWAMLAVNDSPEEARTLLMNTGIPLHPHNLALAYEVAARADCLDDYVARINTIRITGAPADVLERLVELIGHS